MAMTVKINSKNHFVIMETEKDMKQLFITEDLIDYQKNSDSTIATVNVIMNVDKPSDVARNIAEVSAILNKEYKHDNVVFLTTAYASRTHYPPEEYYLSPYEEKGKKELPIDDIVDEISGYLEANNWININHFTNYKYQKSFVLNNKGGKQVLKYIDKVTKEALI